MAKVGKRWNQLEGVVVVSVVEGLWVAGVVVGLLVVGEEIVVVLVDSFSSLLCDRGHLSVEHCATLLDPSALVVVAIMCESILVLEKWLSPGLLWVDPVKSFEGFM
eukprot:TRINITY_DN129470_c0_g1_i1.p3 TRINITY_DN129470_c0_g1~~TRINITY_DN129470_c0_g1_i1.p3  ORF type:complete len:106 (-),score=14.33 TRINITY_DN129470_c0_g1_i1:7-324(-)